MMLIEPVEAGGDLGQLEAARALFRGYAGFLREIGTCPNFDFEQFRREIRALPEPYTALGGEVLLASHFGAPAGCVAFRTCAEEAGTCELKRLFVLPAFRGRGLGGELVAEALRRACLRGFGAAVLDTEPSSMAAAYRLYRELGFVPYTPKGPVQDAGLMYLRKPLVRTPAEEARSAEKV